MVVSEVVSEATLDSIGSRLKWFDRMCEVVDPKATAVAAPTLAQLKRTLGTTLASDVRNDAAVGARFRAALTKAADAVSGMADVALRAGKVVRRIDAED